MALHTLWFIIIAVFWCGFFVLEGFDFGVGVLHRVVGRTDLERRVAVNTIGPFWDGNEVWLIVAGAATFAAFPSWYATMFSTFYLALMLVLVALIARGVSFEFRGKIADPRWRGTWSWALTIGSALVPAAARGGPRRPPPRPAHQPEPRVHRELPRPPHPVRPVDRRSPSWLLSVLSGATFLALKTTGAVHDRSVAIARPALDGRRRRGHRLRHLEPGRWPEGFFPTPFAIVAVLAVLAAVWLVATEHRRLGVPASVIAMAGTVATIFIDLYSNVMVSSTNAAYNLTVANASSSSYALKVMTVVAVIFIPLVLLYQGWSYWVFRGRLSAPAQDVPGSRPVHEGSAASARSE